MTDNPEENLPFKIICVKIILLKLGKFSHVPIHIYLVLMFFMPSFHFNYTDYFGSLILCSQIVAR